MLGPRGVFIESEEVMTLITDRCNTCAYACKCSRQNPTDRCHQTKEEAQEEFDRNARKETQ